MVLDDTLRRRLIGGAAILAGLAVPSLISGRVPIAIAIVVAIVLYAVCDHEWDTVARLTRHLRSTLGRAVLAVFAIWLISAAASQKPAWSLMIWALTGLFTVAAVYFRERMADEPGALRLTLMALVAGGLAGAAVAIVSLYIWPELLGYFRGRDVPTAYDARQTLKSYGSASACLIPMILWAGFALGGRWRWAGLAYLPLALIVIHGVAAKDGYLGLMGAAATALVVSLVARLKETPRRVLIAAIMTAGAAAIAVLVSHLPAIPYDPEAGHWIPLWMVDAHRQVIWSFALDRAMESPWIGYGIDVGGSLPGAKVVIPVFNQEYLPSHAHSWPVEQFVEAGALGLLAMAAALFLFLRMLASRLAGGDTGAWAAVGLAGAFWGSGLVNFSLWAAWWQATFLFLTAIALAAPGRRGATTL